jgi:hypothetical protein
MYLKSSGFVVSALNDWMMSFKHKFISDTWKGEARSIISIPAAWCDIVHSNLLFLFMFTLPITNRITQIGHMWPSLILLSWMLCIPCLKSHDFQMNGTKSQIELTPFPQTHAYPLAPFASWPLLSRHSWWSSGTHLSLLTSLAFWSFWNNIT